MCAPFFEALEQRREHHPRKVQPQWSRLIKITKPVSEVLIVEFESVSDDCLEGSSFVVIETVAARSHLRECAFKIEFLEKKFSMGSGSLDQRIAEHGSPHLRRQISAPVFRKASTKQHRVRPDRP
jgi:hypothetical protein